MHRFSMILFGVGAWTCFNPAANAQQPYGGIPPYYFIIESSNGADLPPIVRDISLEQASGNQGLYRDVIVGYFSFGNPPQYLASSPTIEFNLDPVLAALTPTRYGEGGKFHYSLYAYNESVVNLREGVFCSLNGGGDGVYFHDESALNVFGGTIKRSIHSFDDSKITITGGKVKGVIAADNSIVDMTGGQLVGDTEAIALGDSRVTVSVSGQTITRAGAQDSAHLTLSDLTVVSLSGAAGQSQVSLSKVTVQSGLGASGRGIITHTGGSVLADVTASDSSNITLNDTTVGGGISAADDAKISVANTLVAAQAMTLGSSILNLTNSIIAGDQVVAHDNSLINLIGGQVNFLGAAKNATATMTSGVILTNLIATDESNITMTGSTIAGGVGAKNHAGIVLQGGVVKGVATNGDPLGLAATDFGTVDVNGTEIQNGGLADQVAEVNLRSGKIVGDFNVRGGASLHVSNGFQITGELSASDNAIVAVNGATVDHLSAGGDATVRIDDIDGHDGYGAGVSAFENSHLFIGGGTIFNPSFYGSAEVTIAGGSFPFSPTAKQNSQLVIAGGTFTDGVEVEDNAEFSMIGGEIHSSVPILSTGDVKATQNAKVTIRDGYISDEVEAHNNSFAAISAGTIGGNMEAYDTARLSITGGVISENLVGYGNSVVTMSDGVVQAYAIFSDNSRFIYSGGKIGQGIIHTSSATNIFGSLAGEPVAQDQFLSPIVIHDNAVLNILGQDLVATLIDPNFEGGMSSLFQLTGYLADGTPIAGQLFAIQNGSGASFALLDAPEPSVATLLVVAFGGSLLGRRQRRPKEH